MTSDLDLYSNGGQIVPINPDTGLQPITPGQDDWGVEPDYLAERPAPASQDPQVAEAFKEIGIVIAADLQRLNHPAKSIAAAQQWYAANMGREPRKERIAHRYNLHNYQSDVMANNFANAMARAGASQEFVSNVLWLLGEAAKRLTGGQQQAVQQTATSADPTDQLSDADYDRVLAINSNAAARTEGYLKDLWGSSWAGNMQVVQQEWNKLSDAEQAHLGQFTQDWVKGTNTPEVIVGLFRQAIGAGSLPTGGAAISQEIASIENVMRTNRKQYQDDNQMQARLRTLYTLRDGG